MQIEIEIVDAFVDGDTGGNPAGIVFGADGMSAARRQAIARHVGLSETAFVSMSAVATRKLDFHTPTRQIAHCGHATIAVFARLAQRGELGDGHHSKETIDGLRDIVLAGEVASMAQLGPRTESVGPEHALHAPSVAALGLDAAQLIAGIEPAVVDTGNRFLLMPVRARAVLAGIRPDQAAIAQISEALDLVGFYAYALDPEIEGRHATTRMFAPRYGIAEEAATGMAAGPLACRLAEAHAIDATTYRIEQGRLMPAASPSVIDVRLHRSAGAISAVHAGGRARLRERLRIEA
jgi:PhzF family phenazine biosynthesis protein